MASFQKRKAKSGEVSYLAWVRIKPFKPATKAFPALAEAKAWAKATEDELRRVRRKGSAPVDLTTMTLETLIEKYLEDPATKALRDYAGRQHHLAWWSDGYGRVKVMQLGVLKIREARDALCKDKQAGTVNRYIAAMRSCWNWGRGAGLLPADHVWPPRLMLPEPKGRERYLTDDELARVLKAARAESLVMLAAVVMALATGMRQGNMVGLTWGDIDLERQRVTLPTTKAGKAHAIPLGLAAVESLQAIRPENPDPKARLFLTAKGKPLTADVLGGIWRAVRAVAEVEDCRWHDLRHSTASFLAQSGANLLQIGAILGHSSPATTKRYAHLVEGTPVTGMDQLDERLRR